MQNTDIARPRCVEFPPFRIDLESEQMWRGKKEIPLRPKAFAILRQLLEQAGRIVSREELDQAVWGTTQVSESILRGCPKEIRQALGDSAERPKFIETIPRRGWRFIAPLNPAPPVVSSQYPVVSRKTATSDPHLVTDNWQLTTHLVGRETELRQLHTWFEKAVKGERQIVFVTGEPGIGKTTLVEAFLAGIRQQTTGNGSQERTNPTQPIPDARSPMPSPWLARGQCVEHYGSGEAYMPVLEALERVGRTAGGESFTALLRRHAPMWLVQMPSLLEPHEQAELQRQLAGTTRERMLREMAVFLEELTVEQPLLLVLEDLHWSDQATVELLAYLARRRDAARLLVLGVYRVGALSPNGHPLLGFTAELQVHGQCAELRLERLSEAEIDEYLGRRFPASVLPTQLAQVLHQRTEGNPLFLVNVVEDLIAQGCLREVEGSWGLYSGLEVIQERIPENLRQFVAQQGTRLSAEEQQTLEAASIAGTEFSAAAVAAALATDTEAVEVHCERLTQRQQFL